MVFYHAPFVLRLSKHERGGCHLTAVFRTNIRLPVINWLPSFFLQIIADEAELVQGGYEVVGDFLGDDVGAVEVFGFFKGFIFEPEDVEAFIVVLTAIKGRTHPTQSSHKAAACSRTIRVALSCLSGG